MKGYITGELGGIVDTALASAFDRQNISDKKVRCILDQKEEAKMKLLAMNSFVINDQRPVS
jgi:hypothetical protein